MENFLTKVKNCKFMGIGGTDLHIYKWSAVRVDSTIVHVVNLLPKKN
jgi:hypothetical protein